MNSHIVRMGIKISSRRNIRKIITYLGVSILLVGSARAFFASWVSAPADVLVLVA
jgi:hypothetical protein